MSDAYTELVEKVRQEHLDIDAQILDLRNQRRHLNDTIKDLSARKTQIARMLLASQPRRKKTAKADGS